MQCSECGLAQLKNKCKQRLLANAIFPSEGSTKSLMLFDDKLRKLHKLYLEQDTGTQAEFFNIQTIFKSPHSLWPKLLPPSSKEMEINLAINI